MVFFFFLVLNVQVDVDDGSRQHRYSHPKSRLTLMFTMSTVCVLRGEACAHHLYKVRNTPGLELISERTANGALC